MRENKNMEKNANGGKREDTNKTVSIFTLGCKVNQYETQAIRELFEKRGYSVVLGSKFADIYIINTCTVTNAGDRKSRQFIRRVKRNNADAIIAVVGCYAQTSPQEVLSIDGVNIIIGTDKRNMIVDLVEKCEPDEKINLVDDIMGVKQFEEMSIENMKGKTRAFLKIQEGCNQYCSYCIIPYARGPARSRNKSEIIKEIKNLVNRGFKEVVLTGIHVASYGKDLKPRKTLMDVLKEVNGINGLKRIRLGSLEPTLFTDDFLQELSGLNKICRHFHLSLQSGCNDTLKRMNRKYTTEQYRNIVNKISKVYPEVALTTDIMVGFPGETEKEFNATYNFVEEIGFSEIHVFRYSPRRGTPAAGYKNQIDGLTKRHRSEKLIELGQRLKRDYYSMFIGKNREVLFETLSREIPSCMEGHTDNFLRVLAAADGIEESKLAMVNLKELKQDYILAGKVY